MAGMEWIERMHLVRSECLADVFSCKREREGERREQIEVGWRCAGRGVSKRRKLRIHVYIHNTQVRRSFSGRPDGTKSSAAGRGEGYSFRPKHNVINAVYFGSHVQHNVQQTGHKRIRSFGRRAEWTVVEGIWFKCRARCLFFIFYLI